MPHSKSSESKAAWDRARRYAAEHNIGVKEARSLLARQALEEASLPKTPTKRPARRATKGACAKPDDLIAAEQVLRKKYPWVIASSIEAHDGGRTVEIACQAKGCQNRRRIHTADAFQVQLCIDCTKTHRQQRRSKSAKKGKV